MPRIPIGTSPVDSYGTVDATWMVPAITAARQQMLDALAGLAEIDPVTHELCRLLNADLQQCQICLRYRYTDSDEQVLSAVSTYEKSQQLTERQRLALRLCDLYLRSPGVPDESLRDALLAEFSPTEIAELLLRQVRYTWNKVMVALGLDGASEPITQNRVNATS